MKNLPCFLTFSAVLGLLAVSATSALGVSLPFESIASEVLAISCAVGVLGFFLADYATPRTPDYRAALALASRREMAPAVNSRRAVRPVDLGYGDAITVNLMSTLGMHNESATLSLV